MYRTLSAVLTACFLLSCQNPHASTITLMPDPPEAGPAADAEDTDTTVWVVTVNGEVDSVWSDPASAEGRAALFDGGAVVTQATLR